LVESVLLFVVSALITGRREMAGDRGANPAHAGDNPRPGQGRCCFSGRCNSSNRMGLRGHPIFDLTMCNACFKAYVNEKVSFSILFFQCFCVFLCLLSM
jgi:hypothetical protein